MIRKILKNTIPIVVLIPEYNLQKALGDLIAGITVGLTLIPQSIAYAALAGVAPQYGLYSSMLGGVLYAIFGTVPALSIAPTALLSLLTNTYTSNLSYSNVEGAILLSFMGGIIQLLCGILQLGFLINFVSAPVVDAFTSAGALTIAASQLKSLFGLKFKAETFLDTIYQFFNHIMEAKLEDSLLSFFCCIFLLLMTKLKRFGNPPNVNSKTSSKGRSSWTTFIWFISIGRNALLVIACTVISFVLVKKHDYTPFQLTGNVPQGLPSLTLPFLIHNSSTNATIDFIDAVKELKAGVAVIPFVGILANIALAKSFFKGNKLNASQEMRALGLCNFIGSFLGSYSVNSAFSRTSVNNASGVRTVLGGIYSAIMVLLALTFLTPYFYFIPKATLGSVIFCAVLHMIKIKMCLSVWKYSKISSIPMITTFIACLVFSIELGILLGIIVDLVFVLYFTSKPDIKSELVEFSTERKYLKVILKDPLCYVSTEFLRKEILKNVQETKVNAVILDFEHVTKIDFTTAKCLNKFEDDSLKFDVKIGFFNLNDRLEELLRKFLTSDLQFIKNECDIAIFIAGKSTIFVGNEYINGGFLNDDDANNIQEHRI